MNKLAKLYYSPKGYWKGRTAIYKLSQLAKVTEQTAKDWLSKQAIWQIYLPAPKQIKRPHFTNTVANDTHQMDLLFLPYDTIKSKRYKYALTVIDSASRYKDAEPLTEKSAAAVAIALAKIYRRGPLKYPRLMQVDEGNEFKGAVNQLLLKHRVTIKRGIPGVHRSQAFVENFNKQLSERLFSYQYHREILDNTRNTEWVKRLPTVLRAMNNEIHSVTKLKPSQAIKQKTITNKTETTKQSPLIPFDVKVRYLYAPGEVEGDTRIRATDPIWSIDTYEIKQIIEMKPPIYYLRSTETSKRPAPKRSFVREELQIVPPDTNNFSI